MKDRHRRCLLIMRSASVTLIERDVSDLSVP